jgi:quinol monooxygenase YgiN
MQRRELIGGSLAMAAFGLVPAAAKSETQGMYGLIGSFKAAPGRRDELVALLLEGSGDMPGCLSYVVAADSQEPDTIWVTEVWRDQADHAASLKLPQVQAAIAKARPLIAGFGGHTVTHPVGGTGLPSA